MKRRLRREEKRRKKKKSDGRKVAEKRYVFRSDVNAKDIGINGPSWWSKHRIPLQDFFESDVGSLSSLMMFSVSVDFPESTCPMKTMLAFSLASTLALIYLEGSQLRPLIFEDWFLGRWWTWRTPFPLLWLWVSALFQWASGCYPSVCSFCLLCFGGIWDIPVVSDRARSRLGFGRSSSWSRWYSPRRIALGLWGYNRQCSCSFAR